MDMIMNSVGGEMGGEEESSQSQSQSQSFLLSEDERRALRGSKFAPLPPSQTLTLSSENYDHNNNNKNTNRRLAHPGGPVKTNKAAALAKFLERKLEQPDGLNSLNPDLLELAVKNAKETVKCGSGIGGPSTSGRIVRHVASFEDDSSEGSGDDQEEHEEIKEKERKRKKKKITRGSRDDQDEHEATKQKKRKRKKKKTAKDARSPKSHKSVKKRRSRNGRNAPLNFL